MSIFRYFWLVCMVSGTEIKIKYDLNLAEDLFQGFIKEYNKSYNQETEYKIRFEIFVDNLKRINKRNECSKTVQYGINQFTDESIAEKIQSLEMTEDIDDIHMNYCNFTKKIKLFGKPPAQWDWRDRNVVTPVKDQGSCGSCWAFAAAGTIESGYAMRHHKLVRLSEQQLLDCTGDNDTCKSGHSPRALSAVKQQEGLASAKDYPYLAEKGRCRAKKMKKVAVVSHIYRHEGKVTETQMTELLYKFGPIMTSK